MRNFSLNLPINDLSFGQTSIAIIRELVKRNIHCPLFPIGPVAYSTQGKDENFDRWIQGCVGSGQTNHSRDNPVIRLWHINGSLESYSKRGNRLITFQETGQLTPTEVNILKQQEKVFVTNKYAQSFFANHGIDSTYLPLGFDSFNFKNLTKRPSIEGVRSWLMVGKAENRKHTYKQLGLWAKKYGNDKSHRLNLAISNSFLSREHQDALINQVLEGKQYWNINRLEFCATNAEYNSLLQSSEIVLACSGAEGFDLPVFHAVALGAWPVALKAHAYLDYLNDSNAVMVNPNGLAPIYDGIFFGPNQPFNQGNLFTFDDNEFISACEKADKKASSSLNINGLLLQNQSYAKTAEILLDGLV